MSRVEPQPPETLTRSRRQHDVALRGPARLARCDGRKEGYGYAHPGAAVSPQPLVHLGRRAADPAGAGCDPAAAAMQEQFQAHGAEAPAPPLDPGARDVHGDVPGSVGVVQVLGARAQGEAFGRGDVSQLPHHELIPDRNVEFRVSEEHRRLPHGFRDQQWVLVAARHGGEEAVRTRPAGRHRELGVGLSGPAGREDVLGIGPVDQLPWKFRLSAFEWHRSGA